MNNCHLLNFLKNLHYCKLNLLIMGRSFNTLLKYNRSIELTQEDDG